MILIVAASIHSSFSSCIANCDVCLYQSCDVCSSGFFYFDYLGCKTCAQVPTTEYNLYKEQCDFCPTGTYLNAAFGCTACTTLNANCIVCIYIPSTAYCSLCAVGYFPSGQSCTSCNSVIAGCSICNPGPECTKCAAGYGLVLDLNECMLCSSITDPYYWEVACNEICFIGSYLSAGSC